MRVNRQRRADHDQRRAVFRHRDRLFDRKAAYGLHGKADCFDDGFQIVERAEALTRVGEDAVSLVEAGVMHDVIDAQVFHPFRGGGLIFANHIVTHHLDPEIAPGFDDAFDRLRVRASHHHHVRRAGFGHHLGFEVTPVHRLQVGDDRTVWKFPPQRAHAVKPFGQNQRRARFEPVNSGLDRDARGFNRFFDVGQVEGDLNYRWMGSFHYYYLSSRILMLRYQTASTWSCRSELANLDIAIPDGVTVVLQQNVAFDGFAESFRIFELALCDALFEVLAAALELNHLHAIQPVLYVIASDDDTNLVEFADRFEFLVFARGDQIVERSGGAIARDASLCVGMVVVIQHLILKAHAGLACRWQAF